MPISPIMLQRRHAELGRIRLGDKQDAGNGRTRPNKLSSFRFTSPSQEYVRDLAELYGGEPQQWDNNGKPEWEVYTTATSIPVIVVKGGLSQWMETWSGGGCVHRCDGERSIEGNLCEDDTTMVTINRQQVRAHDAAKPTTRLSVMLPELDAIGVWRMESHGWNAAAEIPAVAELAQYVGDLVPAVLHLVERRVIKEGKTSRFVVPVLDLRIGQARLREIVAEVSGGESLAVASTAPAAALEAPAQPLPDYDAVIASAQSTEELRSIWTLAQGRSHLTDDLRARIILAVERFDSARADGPGASAEVVQAAVVEQLPVAAATSVVAEGNADAIWQQILAVAGGFGWSLEQTQNDFSWQMGGLTADAASVAELQTYLGRLTSGEKASA